MAVPYILDSHFLDVNTGTTKQNKTSSAEHISRVDNLFFFSKSANEINVTTLKNEFGNIKTSFFFSLKKNKVTIRQHLH